MSGRILLDTNIVVEFLRGNASIAERLRQVDQLFTFSIVLGELCFGALVSAKVVENMQSIDAFASTTSFLTADLDTAREYSKIRKMLRDKGKPIPENDIWIAAACKQHDLTLVTRDAHFGAIDDLDQEWW